MRTRLSWAKAQYDIAKPLSNCLRAEYPQLHN